MKLARFEDRSGDRHWGIVDEDGGISETHSPFAAPVAPSEERFPLADVRLLAPVIPPDILAIGRNYSAHAAESGMDIPDHPTLFIKATASLADPEGAIQLPSMAPDQVDYEAELAIVIGRTAHNVTEAQADQFILGYTCANDVSARDCQLQLDMQWARAKSFATFCPLGPWIETDLDPAALRIQSRLNGNTMQDACTDQLVFNCSCLVSYLSRCMPLHPGTIILTGTPAGVGFARKPPVFLRDGDVVEIEVEGIGVLRNTVSGASF